MKFRWSNETSFSYEFLSGKKNDFWRNLQDAYAAYCLGIHKRDYFWRNNIHPSKRESICTKCQEKIEIGEGITKIEGCYDKPVQWIHAKCLPLPKIQPVEMYFANLHILCGVNRWTEIVSDRKDGGGYCHVLASDKDVWHPVAGQHGADSILYINILMPFNPVSAELWAGAVKANQYFNYLHGFVCDVADAIKGS